MLPWDLEDWLTETGDVIVHRLAASESITREEQVVHDVWLLDTETRNGGVSQYFGNHGREEWNRLTSSATFASLPTLIRFIATVDEVLGSRDPYDAITRSTVDLDDAYYSIQTPMVHELRAWFEASAA